MSPHMMSSLMVPFNGTSPLDNVYFFETLKALYLANDLVFMYAFFIVFMLIFNSMTLSTLMTRTRMIAENGVNTKLFRELLDRQGKTFYFSERGKKLHSERDSRHLKFANVINEVFFTDEQILVLRQLQCISEEQTE